MAKEIFISNNPIKPGMQKGTNLIRIFTGEKITANHLKSELESIGINVLIKDEYSSGISVGFVAGIPSDIDLYIQETDFEKAKEILHSFET